MKALRLMPQALRAALGELYPGDKLSGYHAQMKQDIIQGRRYLPEDNWFARRVGNRYR